MKLIELLEFIDLLGVAVLIPLLPAYFKSVGCGLGVYSLSRSVYNGAQVLSGLALSMQTDSKLSRKKLLLVSFLGSAVSYFMVGFAKSCTVLILTRLLVGLVKQTMTISTAIIADCSDRGRRVKELGRLGGASSLAFIVGPCIGSFLYRLSPLYPCLLASSVFIFNSLVLSCLVPNGDVLNRSEEPEDMDGQRPRSRSRSVSKPLDPDATWWHTFCYNFKTTCSEPTVAWVVFVRLAFAFLARSLNANDMGYYEERFGLDLAHIGYIKSYQNAVVLLVQLFLVAPIARRADEAELTTLALGGLVAAHLFEASPSVGKWEYLTLCVPLKGLGTALLRVCLESLFTEAVPPGNLGAALGLLNVLQAAVGVVAPVYGGWVFAQADRMAVHRRPAVVGLHYAAL
ncbi:unnamed protein product, partial [Heterosigma akashiwo]